MPCANRELVARLEKLATPLPRLVCSVKLINDAVVAGWRWYLRGKAIAVTS